MPNKSEKNECGIINLDSFDGSGTHWTAYIKTNRIVHYFDSFGNLPPPEEFIKYVGSDTNIHYNYKRYQNYDTNICGQLCIQFLYNFYNQ